MVGEANDKIVVINHLLYLTTDQRRTLLEEKTPVQIVGVSVPVWFNQGKSNEPALEMFCQYTITNEPHHMMVQTLPTGYRINLPQSRSESEDSRDRLPVPDQKKLGDVEGVGWLIFKQFQTINDGPETTKVLHYIEMRDIEYYWDSVRQKDSSEETVQIAC